MTNIRRIFVSIGIFILMTQNVHSATVNFSVTGEIISATPTNPFNISTGSLITASGTFDDSPIGSGETFIDFSTLSNNMEIAVGNTVFTDTSELYSGGLLFFYDGVFDGLTYEALDDSFDSYGYLGEIGTSGNLLPDFDGIGIEGNWLANSFSVTPVPLPGAFWLFATGLLFLFRRKE